MGVKSFGAYELWLSCTVAMLMPISRSHCHHGVHNGSINVYS